MKLTDDELPARALVLDRDLIRIAYAARTRHGNAPHDEVWDGMLVLNPLPNNEHRRLVMAFCEAFTGCTDRQKGDYLFPGCNVSDRDAAWKENYRCPDVVVYLATNPATDSDTHWVGGPDLAVEVTSPGEDPRLKLDFYAKVNTRELLIVDRDPWAVEMYQLQGGKLVLAGTSDLATGAVLASAALPLTFQLRPGTPRPTILVTHTATVQTWTA